MRRCAIQKKLAGASKEAGLYLPTPICPHMAKPYAQRLKLRLPKTHNLTSHGLCPQTRPDCPRQLRSRA